MSSRDDRIERGNETEYISGLSDTDSSGRAGGAGGLYLIGIRGTSSDSPGLRYKCQMIKQIKRPN